MTFPSERLRLKPLAQLSDKEQAFRGCWMGLLAGSLTGVLLAYYLGLWVPSW